MCMLVMEEIILTMRHHRTYQSGIQDGVPAAIKLVVIIKLTPTVNAILSFVRMNFGSRNCSSSFALLSSNLFLLSVTDFSNPLVFVLY